MHLHTAFLLQVTLIVNVQKKALSEGTHLKLHWCQLRFSYLASLSALNSSKLTSLLAGTTPDKACVCEPFSIVYQHVAVCKQK